MNPLVVFESIDDSSAQIAQVIADCLGAPTLAAADARRRDLETADLLVIGGPTHKRGVSPALRKLIAEVTPGWLVGVRTATFDTRVKRPGLLTGSAARALARRARKKGAVIIVPPRSFFVAGHHGPLLDGELEAAANWAATVARAIGVSRGGEEPPKKPPARIEVFSHEYPEQLVTPVGADSALGA
jgi:flavodoxin